MTPATDNTDVYDQAPMSASLRALARRGSLQKLKKGVQIITEGDTGDTIYIVLSGRLRAFSVGADDREITYGAYGAGEYVGELSLDGGLRLANVVTLEPTLCALVTPKTLLRHIEDEPAFAFELLAKVIRRARQTKVSLRQIALNSVYGRLKALLEAISQLQPDGSRLADPAPSHLEMSRLLGCSREMVSRVMKDLERGRYLEVGRRRVVIPRPLPDQW
jgi:CRP/FNR family cyclic AMP-dependent transcriptional regulator